jgi:pSer/pThr/pTyr-binding forkhead associated (FHA) protein
MSASLVFVTADGRQREIGLNRPVQVIGRQVDCQIRIPTGAVSRHHCEVIVDDNRVTLRDLGSSNGSYVNRKRVNQQQELAPGDLICIGEQVFVLRVGGRPSDIDAEDAYEDGLVKTPAGGTPASAPKAASAAPAKRSAPKANSDDSSVMDFDFLDEDDIDRKQPKL